MSLALAVSASCQAPAPTEVAAISRSVVDSEYGQYYGYGPVPSEVGAAVLQPHSAYFQSMRPDAIKAPHGHFQHFAPADPGDDFPYAKLRQYEAQEVAAGRPPIFVTATYEGKKRPVYFSWHLALDGSGRPTADPSQWSQAVNVRDDRFIRFYAETYVHQQLWQPPLDNYWHAVDNCSFRMDNYGVLDDFNVFHTVDRWDKPFAQSDSDFLDSIKTFLTRLKQIAPDIRIMGNEGSMSDESRFADVWAGFDGTIREDITSGFAGDSYSRAEVYKFYQRYKWEGPAGKVAILRALLPQTGSSSFSSLLRTSYSAYLIFRGPNFFFAPRFDDSSAKGVPPDLYASMRASLGPPAEDSKDMVYGSGAQLGLRLYSRRLEGGIVYLNWTGATVKVPLPADRSYYDRKGNRVTYLSIPDLRGDYVTNSPAKHTGASSTSSE